MKSVMIASAFVAASADNVNLSFQDCGSDSTHATVYSLQPDHIDVPGQATVVGSGNLDYDQTSAYFHMEVKKGFLTVAKGEGSICEDNTINLPMGVGSVTVRGLQCPILAGDVSVYVDMDLKLIGPGSVSIHIDANADDTGDQVICLDVDAKTGPAPPPSPTPPTPSPPSPAPSPPSPTPYPSYWQTITPNSDTNLCLDLPGGDTSNGNQLWLWECSGGLSQMWRFDNWQIRYAPDESKCIDAGDMGDGSQMMLWDCNGYPQQTWGYDDNAQSVYLADTSTCLDFYGDWDSNGQPLHVWDCTGDWNQQWAIWDPSAASIV